MKDLYNTNIQDHKTVEYRIPNKHAYRISILPNHEKWEAEDIFLGIAVVIIVALIGIKLGNFAKSEIEKHYRTQAQARLPFTKLPDAPKWEKVLVTNK